MKHHYAITATVRYYKCPVARVRLDGQRVIFAYARRDRPFNIRRWKEPPHVALANLLPDAAALARFIRAYGPLSDLSVGPAFSGTKRPQAEGYTTVAAIKAFQESLRGAWQGDQGQLANMVVNRHAWFAMTPEELAVDVKELWTLIQMLFLQDYMSGRVKVCSNPDCPAPYFLAARKGHDKFCSQQCAVLVNVRRFREREAKRRKKTKTDRRKHAKEA